MNVLEFTAVVAIVSFVAGLLGSLTGLGGGVVLVPLLTIFFHVDIRYAIGASLVSVIATSSGAAAFRSCPALLGICFPQAAHAGPAQSAARSARHPSAAQRQFP